MNGLKKICFRLSKIFFVIACIEVVSVLIYQFGYKGNGIIDGTFVYEENKNGNSQVKGVVIFDLNKIGKPSLYPISDFEEIKEPLLFKFLPNIPGEDMIKTKRLMHKGKQIFYEVNRDGIFQKTGSMKWRFFQWDFISGSKANPVVEDMRQLLRPMMISFHTGTIHPEPPLQATARYRIFTPFWITLLFLAVSIILLIISGKLWSIIATDNKNGAIHNEKYANENKNL